MTIQNIDNAIRDLRAIYPQQESELQTHRFRQILYALSDRFRAVFGYSKYNNDLKIHIIEIYALRTLTQLEKIIHDSQTPEAILIEQLSLFLEENWNFIKGSLLAYTSLPDHAITLLLCDIAKYIAEKNPTLPAIQLLMPTINLTSLSDDYPNLNDEDLQVVIKTHVLSEDHQFLIPISVLNDKAISDLESFPNIYFDYQKDNSESTYLNNEELYFLANHSSETKSIYSLRNQYKKLSENHDTLLGQLNQLIRSLQYNSVDEVGEELSAGEGGYAAIVKFLEFWELLDQKKIPEEIKTEINKLRDLGSNPSLQGSSQSCFALRQEKLKDAITGKEASLLTIRIDKTKKDRQDNEIIENFEKAKTSLKNQLKNRLYSGQDHRGITQQILNTSKIHLKFTDLNDCLFAFRGTRSEEISKICASKNAPKKILNAIASIENFVFLVSEISDKALTTLLNEVKTKISLLIKSKRDFLEMLLSLPAEQAKIVCESLKEQLPKFIKTYADFIWVLHYLTPNRQSILLAAGKDKLLPLIKNALDFRTVLHYLKVKSREFVFNNLKAQLSAYIKNLSDLKNVLNYLTPEQCIEVFESASLKEKLTKIIKNAHDFKNVLYNLKPSQCYAICNALISLVPSLIKNTDDLQIVFDQLNQNQRDTLFTREKDKILSLIKTARDFQTVLYYLPKQRVEIFNDLKQKLPSLIKTTANFRSILHYLTPEQCTEVCESASLKEKLAKIIKNAHDFQNIFYDLKPNQRYAVCNALISLIPSFIKNTDDLQFVFEQLKQNQRDILFTREKDKILSLIKTAQDFRTLLYYLPKQRVEIFNDLKQKLPSLIKTSANFRDILHCLPTQQCNELCQTLKPRFPRLIKKVKDFVNIFQDLNPSQCQILCNALEDQIFSSIIKNAEDYLKIFYALSLPQREILFAATKQNLFTIIKDAWDFEEIFRYLTTAQCTELAEILKDKLPLLIKDSNEFDRALQYLTEDRRNAILEAFKEQQLIIGANCALNTIQLKSAQLKTGSTSVFFQSISQKKQTILANIGTLANEFIQKSNHSEDASNELKQIKSIVEKDLAILKIHRGFFKFNETSSDKIATALVSSLERLNNQRILK